MSTTLAVLLTVYFFLFAFLAWRRPLAALCLITAFLPSYLIRFNVMGIPMTMLEGMILILITVIIIKKLQIANCRLQIADLNPRFAICNLQFAIPIVLLLLAATVSMFIAPDLRAAAGIWKAYFIEPFLFFAIMLSILKTEKDRQWLILSLGISALYISAFAVYQKFTGFLIPNPFWAAEATRRVTSVYGYPNAIGLYVAPIIVLAVGQLLSILQSWKNPKSQITTTKQIPNPKLQTKQNFSHWNLDIGHCLEIGYWSLVILSSALAIIFSHTEGAWIAIPLGLIFFGLLMKKYRRLTGILTILAILIILTILPLRSYIWRQITLQGDSGKIHLTIWKESLAMLRDHPILGAGLSGYQTAITPYHKAKHIEIYMYPHNIILNFWSELGLLGLFVFMWLIVLFFKQGIKNFQFPNPNYQITNAALMAAMAVIIIHGLVDVPYFKNDLSILFWLFLGLVTSKQATMKPLAAPLV